MSAVMLGVVSSESPALEFSRLYEAHFDFVWRTVRRFGIPEGSVADATQEVFIVVHRKLGDFEARSSTRTWLYSIVRRVVSDRRRALSPSHLGARSAQALEDLPSLAPGPEHQTELRSVLALLEQLDEDKREVFVLAELEQLSMPEISALLGLNLNTAHARLRAARQHFEQAASRLRAKEARWGT